MPAEFPLNRKRGRPARTSEPFVIRGTVPETHPYFAQLKAMGSAGAARAILQMIAQPLEATSPTPSLATNSSLGPNLLNLNFSQSASNSSQVVSVSTPKPIVFDDDMADLLNFTGAGG